ncbi:hypothetical protein ID855_19835 [Xenorhabdus sp. ZM]|uniref:hypothetical protein n=1 Tax=Xenorhabdus szentirmaii TaxID=290112 RepID=UPI00199848CA|nr:hypothetical protein [Xenorhabdus sp. ZM]MBD2806886.1 hypothetical protein [Xenorhabdus sp. ZM]
MFFDKSVKTNFLRILQSRGFITIPNGFQVASRQQGNDKFVGNEFEQPKVERQEPLIIPGRIDNRVLIKTVTRVSERSQQRGNLKDEGDILWPFPLNSKITFS